MTSPLRKILAKWPVVAISTFLCLALAVATLPTPPHKAKGPVTYHGQETLALIGQASASSLTKKAASGSSGGSSKSSKSKSSSALSTVNPQVLEHYLALAESPATQAAAAKLIGGNATAKSVARQIGVAPNKSGQLVVSAKVNNAVKAAAAASDFAKALIAAALASQVAAQKQQEAAIKAQLAVLARQVTALEAAAASSATTTSGGSTGNRTASSGGTSAANLASTTVTTTATTTTTASTTSTTVARSSGSHTRAKNRAASSKTSATTTPATSGTTRPRASSRPNGTSTGKTTTPTTTPRQNVNSVSLSATLAYYNTLYHQLLQVETRNSSKVPLEVVAVKKPKPIGVTKPSTIRKRYWLAGGLLGGLLIGILIAVLMGLLDRSVTDERRAEELLGIPVLTYVPRLSGSTGRGRGPEVTERPMSPVSESYRRLASALERAPGHMIAFAGSSVTPVAPDAEGRSPDGGSRRTDGARQFLGLVGAVPRSGCSTVVANLAATLAEFGFAPVAVDADLRSPSLDTLLGVPPEPGLTDDIGPGEAPVSPFAPGVRVLPAGRPVANPPGAIQQLLMHLPEWRYQIQLALLDIAEMSSASDAAILARELDGMVLVCARRALTPRRAPRIVRDLGRIATPVLGVVLVEVPSNRFSFAGTKQPRLNLAVSRRPAKRRGKKARATDVEPTDTVESDLLEQPVPPTVESPVQGSNPEEAQSDAAAEASR
jgi:Mrp family chromosome partitioning ATPase/capsular polysaccharide biosynthesis protein